MIAVLLHLLQLPPFLVGGHRQLALENVALRHQLAVYKRTVTRPRLRPTDRFFWIALARVWSGWRQPLLIVTRTLSHGGATSFPSTSSWSHCRPARALRSRRIRSPSPTSRPFQNIPTVHWASRQIVGAFPDDSAPVYLLRDRDAVYGDVFRQRVTGMGIGEVLPTARGRMPSRSDSSARSRASAWTTSSSSASGTCDASSPCTSRTITGLALTSRSTRLHPLGGRSSRLSSAPSSRFPKLGRGVFLEGLERSGPGFGEGQVHGSRTKHRQAAPARAPCFSTLRGRAHLARQRARQIVFGCLR
jgi:hypothetical protein